MAIVYDFFHATLKGPILKGSISEDFSPKAEPDPVLIFYLQIFVRPGRQISAPLVEQVSPLRHDERPAPGLKLETLGYKALISQSPLLIP